VVKGLESKIDEMLKRAAYAEAVALIKTTSEGASDADRESLDKAQKRVIEHALKQFEKDKTKATVLMADDRYDDALAVMKNAVRYGIDTVTEEATSEIERITALKTQAEPKTETVAATGPGEKPRPDLRTSST
jgi:hypothetical protein